MNAMESVRWKGRDATQQANGVVELITLTSGGHFASFRLVGEAGRLGENVIWEPPWQTYDQLPGLSQEQLRTYGPPVENKFMAGYTRALSLPGLLRRAIPHASRSGS